MSPVSTQRIFDLRGLKDKSINAVHKSGYLSGMPSSKAAGGISMPYIQNTAGTE